MGQDLTTCSYQTARPSVSPSSWLALEANSAPAECSRRWHEALKLDIDRGRWSLADVGKLLVLVLNHGGLTQYGLQDVILRNAVRAHGRRWIEIVERYFPNRTPIATRNR